MRARRFARRLVGLPLFAVLLLGTPPALAAVTGSSPATAGQAVTSATWAMVFTSTSIASNADGSLTVTENGSTLVTLSNLSTTGPGAGSTNRVIPATYHTFITLTSNDSTGMGAYLCSGTWSTGITGTTCSGTQTQIGSTTGSTAFMPGQVIPAGYSSQVRIGYSGLSGSLSGKVTLSVSVTAA